MRTATVAIIAVFSIVVVTFGITFAGVFHETQYTACKVDEKDRVANTDGGSEMRLYTSCGVIKVGDVITRAQFDSADMYSDIDPGNTYNFTTVGFRVPPLSMFPTVIEYEKV